MGSSDRPCSSSCSVATMGVILKLSILVAVLMAWWGRVGASRAEVEVLMEIKSALDPTEKILHSWVAEGDPCSGTFEGVACNEHGKVANVSLQGKGLSGSLPSSIADLKCLSGLYLHYNVLKGQIPKELSKLTELLDLYLNVNMLSGSIPGELGSMSSLQALQLCCNELEGPIPKELGSLQKLTVLALQHNHLTAPIPSSLGKLSFLTRLDLSFNFLTGFIPPELANLPQLTILDVRNNNLSGSVPEGIEYLHQGITEPIVHQNISASNVLLDQHLNPLISDCALHKILADDIVFSILKASAAMGYLAPEYATTGRLTDKSDVYAFGKILLQLLTGTTKHDKHISSSHHRIKPLVELSKLEEFMDPSLKGKYSLAEAMNLAKIALACTGDLPNQRPSMSAVVQNFDTGIHQTLTE